MSGAPRNLAGRWLVRRRGVDHRVGQSFTFVGEALITPSRFEERGVMRVNGAEMAATRAYVLGEEGGILHVLRKDGTLFFSLDLNAPAPIHHRCGEDDYAGRFLQRGAECWAERWRVRGPRKRYSSLSVFRRP